MFSISQNKQNGVPNSDLYLIPIEWFKIGDTMRYHKLWPFEFIFYRENGHDKPWDFGIPYFWTQTRSILFSCCFLWWFLSGNQSWNSVPLVVLVQETVGHNIDPKTLLEKYFKGPMWWVHWDPIFEGPILRISPFSAFKCHFSWFKHLMGPTPMILSIPHPWRGLYHWSCNPI